MDPPFVPFAALGMSLAVALVFGVISPSRGIAILGGWVDTSGVRVGATARRPPPARPHSSVWLPHRNTVWMPHRDTVWLPHKDTVWMPHTAPQGAPGTPFWTPKMGKCKFL